MHADRRGLRLGDTGVRAFLRSRRTGFTLLASSAIGVLVAVAGDVSLPVPGAHDGTGVPLAIPTATIAPLIVVALIVNSQRTRLRQPEFVAARNLRVWILAQSVALAATTGLLLTLAAWSTPEPYGVGVVMRNYLVLTALGFGACCLVVPQYAWLVPTVVSFSFLSALGAVDWNPLLSTDASASTLIACALLAFAACLAAAFFSKQRR